MLIPHVCVSPSCGLINADTSSLLTSSLPPSLPPSGVLCQHVDAPDSVSPRPASRCHHSPSVQANMHHPPMQWALSCAAKCGLSFQWSNGQSPPQHGPAVGQYPRMRWAVYLCSKCGPPSNAMALITSGPWRNAVAQRRWDRPTQPASDDWEEGGEGEDEEEEGLEQPGHGGGGSGGETARKGWAACLLQSSAFKNHLKIPKTPPFLAVLQTAVAGLGRRRRRQLRCQRGGRRRFPRAPARFVFRSPQNVLCSSILQRNTLLQHAPVQRCFVASALQCVALLCCSVVLQCCVAVFRCVSANVLCSSSQQSAANDQQHAGAAHRRHSLRHGLRCMRLLRSSGASVCAAVLHQRVHTGEHMGPAGAGQTPCREMARIASGCDKSSLLVAKWPESPRFVINHPCSSQNGPNRLGL